MDVALHDDEGEDGEDGEDPEGFEGAGVGPLSVFEMGRRAFGLLALDAISAVASPARSRSTSVAIPVIPGRPIAHLSSLQLRHGEPIQGAGVYVHRHQGAQVPQLVDV